MAHLIDKDALVAEIKRRMDENRGKQSLPQYFGMVEEDLNILSFIDTLEVKEVDLEKELSYDDYDGFFKEHPNFPDDWGFDETWVFAKHFFELGLKAKEK